MDLRKALLLTPLFAGIIFMSVTAVSPIHASTDEDEPAIMQTECGNDYLNCGGGGGYAGSGDSSGGGGGGSGWSSDPYVCGDAFCSDVVVTGDPPEGSDNSDAAFDDNLDTSTCDSAGWCGWGTGSSAGEAYPCADAVCQDVTVEGDLTTLPQPEPNIDCQRMPTPDEVNRCIQDCRTTGYFNEEHAFWYYPNLPSLEPARLPTD